MKKIVIALICLFVSVLANAQEKVEMRLDLKNGTSLTGMVQMQSDGSIVEMSSGDIFYFSPAEVERAVNIKSISSQVGESDNYGGIKVEKKKGK